VTALRERLAQMGEASKAAAAKAGGTGRWTCQRERQDGTALVYAPSMGPLRQIVPIAETLGVYGKHIAAFSPDVAAALVAVAVQAERGATDIWKEAPPGADQGILHAVSARRVRDMKAALDALAAALGVSR